MSRTTHHYLIFETAGGFCGIAWNSMGITRFQLPTRSAKATERILLRRVPGAEPRAPTLEVAEAVAAVKRYFEGEETDFSGFRLDLGEQDPFFERIYAAARRVAWGTRRAMALWPMNSAPGRRPRAMSVKPWPGIRWR
jgi:methylated-DNA-[protein]-cysteine S-methyltransferase